MCFAFVFCFFFARRLQVLQQVLQSITLELQSRCSSTASTSSIYETASDLGSTSTTASGQTRSKHDGINSSLVFCFSFVCLFFLRETVDGAGKGNGKWRRRKRANLTGWPRSKRRKPTTGGGAGGGVGVGRLSCDVSDVDDDDASDDLSDAPYLSPCRELLAGGGGVAGVAGATGSDATAVAASDASDAGDPRPEPASPVDPPQPPTTNRYVGVNLVA